MKHEEDKLDELFNRLDGQWDIEAPAFGHSDRFEKRLDGQKPKARWMPMAAAASLVGAIGIWFMVHKNETQPDGLKFASEETRQTDSVFNSLIAYQMNQLREQQSPANKQVVDDAIRQLKGMESDYAKIKSDLARNGESEQVIAALIQNLQTQISFLQSVMEQLKKHDNLKKFDDEKNS